jgi:hypothetical protein
MTTARRWLAFLSAAVLLGLSLTGLAAATLKDPRTRYIETYESISGARMTYTELQLPTIGQMNCDSLEDGYSLPDVYTDNIITGLSGDQSAYTIEAAIQVYCPQFSSLLED